MIDIHANDNTRYHYGVATISRMLKNIGLFCKRALQKRPVFCKETCIFKHPTHRSHPIPENTCVSITSTACVHKSCHVFCWRCVTRFLFFRGHYLYIHEYQWQVPHVCTSRVIFCVSHFFVCGGTCIYMSTWIRNTAYACTSHEFCCRRVTRLSFWGHYLYINEYTWEVPHVCTSHVTCFAGGVSHFVFWGHYQYE